MGFEYRVSFRYPSADAVTVLLDRVPGVSVRRRSDQCFEFRNGDSTGETPAAEARVEPWGLYFCACDNSGRSILGLILTNLVGAFDAVTVSDLE